MGDWDVIQRELDAADREHRLISDLGARVIAAQFQTDQASALYALASTGAIIEGWDEEIAEAAAEVDEGQARAALAALTAYCEGRPDKGPQPHWSSLTW